MHLLTHPWNAVPLFASEVDAFDSFDEGLHFTVHLHIYRPLHPDGRRRHDGRRVQVDQHVSQLLLDVTVIHSWYCGRAVCWNIRIAKEQDFLKLFDPHPHGVIVSPTLTLCSDRVGDGTGVADAVRVRSSNHEQVDGSRLQVPQHKGVCLHVLHQGHPSAA